MRRRLSFIKNPLLGRATASPVRDLDDYCLEASAVSLSSTFRKENIQTKRIKKAIVTESPNNGKIYCRRQMR